MNNFNGIGRLTADAELRYTGAGIAFVNFSICINKVWKDKNGERKEKPIFLKCVLWGKYGELMQPYLTKGKQIGLEAELDQNTWADNAGNNHSAIQLVVNQIYLLASPKGEKDNGAKNTPPPNNSQPGEDNIPF
jgi:single-strand DNA-binding protein